MTITKARNLSAIQMDAPCPVIDQDEIVSCAVHFGEVQHGQNCSGCPDRCHVECHIRALPDDVSVFTYPS
jgi:transcription elongation factor Elf1